MMKRILVMFVLMFAATAGYAFGECRDADKKALEAYDRSWGEAQEKGDRAAFMNIYADDFVSIPQMTNKTQAIENRMKSFERDKVNPLMAELKHENSKPGTSIFTH